MASEEPVRSAIWRNVFQASGRSLGKTENEVVSDTAVGCLWLAGEGCLQGCSCLMVVLVALVFSGMAVGYTLLHLP
jgi:hypothetical protein